MNLSGQLPRSVLLLLLCLLAACSAEARKGGPEQRWPKPELKPGGEVRVDAPECGGHFVIYVPTDYSPDRKWPVIYCYHGLNGTPTSSPFRRATEGKGFIIVGMGYLERGVAKKTLAEMERYAQLEVFSFECVAAYVESRLSVDKELYFCGGFSKGGWWTSMMAESVPEAWAGCAILGAGRQKRNLRMKDPDCLRKMPIYIGCGTQDKNFWAAEEAAAFYRKHGAKVTFEPYKGRGHTMGDDLSLLRNWLWTNGPHGRYRLPLIAARQAEQEGRLGRAYTLYRELSRVSENPKARKEAAEGMKRIAQRAEGMLAQAKQAQSHKRHAEAARILTELTTEFQGSDFAGRADALLKKLRANPEIRAAALREQADRECHVWLNLAENYVSAGSRAKARQLLQRIITKYDGTEWATKARKRLDALDGAGE